MDELKVIIVEDDAIIAQLIELHIEQAGHHVIAIAHDSERALDLIHNQQPDLVFLDIHILGNKNGIEVAEVIHRKYKIPFIFITAFSDPLTLQKAAAVQPISYLVKPYKKEDLIAAISIGLVNYQRRQKDISLSRGLINDHALSEISSREYEILMDIANGLTNDQIAAKQYLSVNTVKWHSTNIYSKLGVKNRTAAAKWIADLN